MSRYLLQTGSICSNFNFNFMLYTVLKYYAYRHYTHSKKTEEIDLKPTIPKL